MYVFPVESNETSFSRNYLKVRYDDHAYFCLFIYLGQKGYSIKISAQQIKQRKILR